MGTRDYVRYDVRFTHDDDDAYRELIQRLARAQPEKRWTAAKILREALRIGMATMGGRVVPTSAPVGRVAALPSEEEGPNDLVMMCVRVPRRDLARFHAARQAAGLSVSEACRAALREWASRGRL